MNINDFATGGKTLKAADLQGRTLQVTILDCTAMEFNEKGTMVQKPVLWFQGKEKGLVLNVTKRQLLTEAYGAETDYWRGKRVSLRPTKTSYEGKIVDAIELMPISMQPHAPQQHAPVAIAQVYEPAGAPPAPVLQAPPQEWRQNAPYASVGSVASLAPVTHGEDFIDSDVPF